MRSIRAGDTYNINMEQILTSFSEPLIYLITFLTVISETGIAPFFFLPGDSLLFSLGLFARQGIVEISVIIPVIIVAGFFGNILGYYLGSIVRGKHHTSPLLKKIPERHIVRTEKFYSEYGSWTILFSRFIPVVRTIAPFLAGVSKMNYKKFILLSAVGAVIWGAIVTLVGFLFGSYISFEYVGYVGLALMVGASVLVPIIVFISHRLFKKG